MDAKAEGRKALGVVVGVGVVAAVSLLAVFLFNFGYSQFESFKLQS